MGQREKVAADLAGMTRIDGLIAVRPVSRDLAGAAAAESAVAGVDAAEVKDFRGAGWDFVPASRARQGGEHPVYRGSDGRLLIDSGQLSVRFAPNTADGVVENILHEHGLAVGRKLGFGPKLFNVRQQEKGSAPVDSVGVARELAAHPEVEYAEPVMIESLGGRGTR
jgi:hypothetical protein